jgi:hypothetical protein
MGAVWERVEYDPGPGESTTTLTTTAATAAAEIVVWDVRPTCRDPPCWIFEERSERKSYKWNDQQGKKKKKERTDCDHSVFILRMHTHVIRSAIGVARGSLWSDRTIGLAKCYTMGRT